MLAGQSVLLHILLAVKLMMNKVLMKIQQLIKINFKKIHMFPVTSKQ